MKPTRTAYSPNVAPRYRVYGFRVLDKKRARVFFIPLAKLSGRSLTIGRTRKCDLRIRHRTVSRQHCMLHRTTDHHLIITDAGSKNGVKIAERGQHSEYRLCSWHRLQIGDQIKLGKVTLVAVDENGACPLMVKDGPDMIRYAIRLYGSERKACRHLNMTRRTMQAILDGDTEATCTVTS